MEKSYSETVAAWTAKINKLVIPESYARTIGRELRIAGYTTPVMMITENDLVTVLEAVHEKRKPYKLLDRSREVKKGVMAETLQELIERGIVKSLVTEHILIFRQPRAFLKAFL